MTSIFNTNIFRIVLLSCVFFVSAVGTAAASNHLVTPLALNLDVNKRDIITESITLTNNDTRMVRLYATVNEVATDNDGVLEGFMQPSAVDRTNTPTTWIEITRGRIELAPGERREIPFTIRMNPKTEPGDYNVFIGFAEASNAPQAQAKVLSGKAPGTLVYLAVDQEQNVFLRLEKFIIDRFVTTENGGALSYTLANAGRVDIIPKGEVIFYDNNGNEVAALPLNNENKPVPAEDAAKYSLEVPKELGLGKYKAFLSVEYGEYLTASVQDTAFFYIVPIKKLIAFFMILMIAAVFIALYMHRRYDTEPAILEYEQVPMYVRGGTSDNQHHDIDLTQKNDS